MEYLPGTNDNPTPKDTLFPSYYNKPGLLGCGEIQETMTSECEGMEGFYMGNAIKYLYRYKNKNGVEDLRKALTYVQFLVNLHTGGEKPHELYRKNGCDEQYEAKYREIDSY